MPNVAPRDNYRKLKKKINNHTQECDSVVSDGRYSGQPTILRHAANPGLVLRPVCALSGIGTGMLEVGNCRDHSANEGAC